MNNLTLAKRKALAIKCDFISHKTLIFDYYGVGAMEFEYLEKVVEEEIAQGKCAIVLDRLEYNQIEETNSRIHKVKITIDETR